MKTLGIEESIPAPRSPWQNAYVERVIGVLRRECTDHIISFSEKYLLRSIRELVGYYNEGRAHQALEASIFVPSHILLLPRNNKVCDTVL
ncbi:MAG: transposase InsO family protein [Planctomycetota bacterium]|jgi:transposase InsO family protein